MNHFYQTTHLPNRTILLEGKEYLYFSGTSYLGLPQNPHFQALIKEGVDDYGNVYGSSRNGNLQLNIYEKAEHQLANWAYAPQALTLSSGMLAGQATIRQLMLDGYTFVYSPDAHPAVWHVPQVEIPTISFEEWSQSITQILATISGSKVAIVTNSVDALRGRSYDFEWVYQLPDTHDIVLVVDDSHGLGVSGNEGKGIWQKLPQLPHIRKIVTASLAKGMGLAGGVIFSDSDTLQRIRYSAYFGGCSPIAPTNLYAYLHATSLYEAAYLQLQQNLQQFSSSVKSLSLFPFIDNYPVFYTLHDELYSFLLEKNILIYSFSYPKPTDKANTRIVLSAWHTTEDIANLSSACHEFASSYL